ncbi:HD-GYP domain-containing protein (c-di-GMP phosphodiesterase class II) [Natronobacillus azotifigens]|uniref:HD domain-containing protein n=1 Tax=Natronobacillus azotifigens TaxID=472978 RepID=A0A9J6R8H2_9BACI|nr:HD domain-containing phosphohydrolase [Natronobacillus azotifigens]MCZ0701944.1 HD domain-containing protein [Natronobacillus azotifigens]
MRLINISEYDHNSMVLGKPIYDSNKRILLAAGRTIDPKIITRLEAIGIEFLFVEDEISKGISIEDMLDMPTWTDAIEAVKTFYHQAVTYHSPKLEGIQKVAGTLLQEVKYRPTLILIPAGTMTKDLQPYAHAVNVTILALLIAKEMGYNDIKQKDLAIGSLVHDIGKILDDDPNKHPEKGFDFLRNISQFSIVSAHIAYQHHERLDGGGFPRKLKDQAFLEMAQICGLANWYDNMISKENFAPHDAMEAIMAASDRAYSHRIVAAFSQSVASYPPGTKVIVDNKEPAIVTKIHKHLQRPIIKLLSNDKIIDLLENPTYMIKPFDTVV